MVNPKYLSEGEQVIVSTRTHIKALILPAIALVVVLVACLVVAVLDLGRGASIGAAVVALVALAWFLLGPLLKWWGTTYTFTDRRFLMRSGVISQSGRTIPINRISGVDFEIGVIDRLFGCGTLVVTDASADGRVLVHDIPRVEQVQVRLADELARQSGQGFSGGRRDDGA